MYLDSTENKLHQEKNVPIHKDVYTNRDPQKKIIYLKPKTFPRMISLFSVSRLSLVEECIPMCFHFLINICYTERK